MQHPSITDQTEAMKARLEAMLHELLSLDATGEESARTVELDQARVGRLSRMDAMQAQAMSIESNRRRALSIRRIKAALLRIESGDYGLCEQCGEAIAAARLNIDPAAALCIECASRQDD